MHKKMQKSWSIYNKKKLDPDIELDTICVI